MKEFFIKHKYKIGAIIAVFLLFVYGPEIKEFFVEDTVVIQLEDTSSVKIDTLLKDSLIIDTLK